MDEIIRQIYTGLKKNDIFIVLSDHGMANEGGHGGSSHMEITTPALFFSKNHNFEGHTTSNTFTEHIQIHEQIDLVSTLCCLFNLQIPADNKGVMFMNDLIAWLDTAHMKTSHIHLKIFQCLNENLQQLDGLFGFTKNAELGDKIKALHLNFTSSFRELNTDEELFRINKQLEKLIRNQVEVELEDQNKDTDQQLYLILSLVWMFIVRTVISNSSRELFIQGWGGGEDGLDESWFQLI